MKDLVFLDTAGWLAAINSRDSHHKEAALEWEKLLAARTRFVLSNLVVAELHALLVRERGSVAGLQLLDAIYADPLYEVVAVDRNLEATAVDNWLRRFSELRLSLTDAVSFQIMHNYGITKAFTLDSHFAAAGFQTIHKAAPNRRRKR